MNIKQQLLFLGLITVSVGAFAEQPKPLTPEECKKCGQLYQKIVTTNCAAKAFKAAKEDSNTPFLVCWGLKALPDQALSSAAQQSEFDTQCGVLTPEIVTAAIQHNNVLADKGADRVVYQAVHDALFDQLVVCAKKQE